MIVMKKCIVLFAMLINLFQCRVSFGTLFPNIDLGNLEKNKVFDVKKIPDPHMPFSMTKPSVCLIACHGGPADHFATYAEVLNKRGFDVQIYATGSALKKFHERGIEVKYHFSLDNLTSEEENYLAEAIAKSCSTMAIIITDVGHVFDVKIQKALSIQATKIPCLAYYDNPESFVPGGYSSIAAEVINVAEGVLFANEKLAKVKIFSALGQEIDLSDKNRFGIGYYPVSRAEKIAEKRKFSHETVRLEFMVKNGIEDNGQKVLVYFGGNNEEYFSKAFPAFLSLVAQSSKEINLNNIIIVIQQHPGAKIKNQDGQQVEAWLKKFGEQPNTPKVILSDFSSDLAQVLADAALYYQTSMCLQFILEGIPTIQIGHETYEDILVKNNLASTVTNAREFVRVVKILEEIGIMPQKDLMCSLGIKQDWANRLEDIINEIYLNN
jgi:hypothetical protein